MRTTLADTDTSLPAHRRRVPVRWLWPLLGIVLALVWLQWASPPWWQPLVADDIRQSRLDVAPAPPTPGNPLQQTFAPRHDGLESVEITLARTGTGDGQGGTLALRLEDEASHVVARQQWPNEQLRHNQTLQLRMPPQPESAGRRYTLSLQGNEANVFSAWTYSLDVYDGGALTGTGDGADLQFATHYRLLPAAALRMLAALAGESAPMLGLLAFLLVLPGSLLLLLGGRLLPRLDPAVWLALATVTGSAFWPVLWQWSSVAGWRWRQGNLLALLVVLALAVLLLLWRRPPRLGPLHWHHLVLGLLLLLALSVRLLAVRDLAFPAWVDSSRHALITRIMVERGQMPGDYTPYLALARVPYHFGFHSIAASLALLGGWPLPRLLLLAGQGLGAAVPLAIYGAAWIVTRRRQAGLLAAFLVALPFYFPTYYASWGRLTQLAGVLVLPLVLVLTWQLMRGARSWRRAWPLLALLTAGLALLHFRVFLLYLLFVPLAWLAARGRGGRSLLAAGALGALLAAPYLAETLPQTAPAGILNAPPQSYSEFPAGYLAIGWERSFWWLAGLAWVVALLATARGRSWARLPLLLAAWPGAIVLVLAGPLPGTWLLNLNSAYIVFFVPVALLLATAAARLRYALAPLPLARALSAASLAFALAVAFFFGIRQQAGIINPETVLAQPADLAGLQWVERHLPDDALIAVNAWQWLGRAWAGTDGGAWILPITGRAATTPPVDYMNSRALIETVDAFNRAVQEVGDWSDPAASAWLHREGVTHIFAGARGGVFDPAALARNPELCQLYAGDGVFVFALRAAAAASCPG
jgi:hypothetical protein